MKNAKYVLIVFKSPMEMEDPMNPREADVLKKVANGDIRGASCGPLNLCTFDSEMERNDISKVLSDADLNFLLFDEKDSARRIPKYLQKLFGITPQDELKKGKLSLEDQLKEAIAQEKWLVAAKIRDKIAAQEKEVKTETKISNTNDGYGNFINEL